MVYAVQFVCGINLDIHVNIFLTGWMNDNKNIDGKALFYLSGIPMIVGFALMILIRKWRRKDSEIIKEKKFFDDDDRVMLQLITTL